jgi:2-hydroxy-3-keto-5-methylthiopentenyl-1-phosphate phosphatase
MQLAHWLKRSALATACWSTGLVQIFSDFDGTITIGDATDMVLDRFADPAWRLVDEEWQSGSIGSRDCLARQIALMRCSPAEFDAAVDEIEIDPFFPRFVQFCRSRRLPLTIVSDGLDRVVFRLLKKLGLAPMRVFANRLKSLPHGRWSIESPHCQAACRVSAGTCKCAIVARGGAVSSVLIGDGQSDICAALEVGFVVAKGRLAEHCATAGVRHAVFRTFEDVAELLNEHALQGRSAAPQAYEATPG